MMARLPNQPIPLRSERQQVVSAMIDDNSMTVRSLDEYLSFIIASYCGSRIIAI
jgi:hypothetical protein